MSSTIATWNCQPIYSSCGRVQETFCWRHASDQFFYLFICLICIFGAQHTNQVQATQSDPTWLQVENRQIFQNPRVQIMRQ